MATRAGQLFCTVSAKSHLTKLLRLNTNYPTNNQTNKQTKLLKNAPKEASKKELRAAYLKEISIVHPDRAQCSVKKAEYHSKFILLRQAWEAYDKESATKDRTVEDAEGTFTEFGVGCSFSDSEEEKKKRWVIMDQACKGWFPDGSLESGKGVD